MSKENIGRLVAGRITGPDSYGEYRVTYPHRIGKRDSAKAPQTFGTLATAQQAYRDWEAKIKRM